MSYLDIKLGKATVAMANPLRLRQRFGYTGVLGQMFGLRRRRDPRADLPIAPDRLAIDSAVFNPA